jgi:hypothetical protein
MLRPLSLAKPVWSSSTASTSGKSVDVGDNAEQTGTQPVSLAEQAPRARLDELEHYFLIHGIADQAGPGIRR